MMTKKETKINGEIYKPKRSISSKIGNDLSKENNDDLKKIKSRHRKTASSYFLGSYVSGNELNKFLQEYKGINGNNKDNNNIKDLKNIFFENNNNNNSDKNNENANDNFIRLSNASFYSYSIDDNNDNQNKEKEEDGSVIIKGEEESLICNNETKSNSYNMNYSDLFVNNPFYELEKNKEKYAKEKSFIPLKNGLKYMKDKEERITESYLLALNGGESNQKKGKNPYLSTASVIEEERSEFIESTSKKQSIVKGNILIKDINFKKKKIENEFNLVLEKSEDEENKENVDININKKNVNNPSQNNSINKKNSKLEFNVNINKINNQKKNKIEKQRKFLRKNKENLLNYFYNLSCNRSAINTNIYKTQNKEKKEENNNGISANNNIHKNNNRIFNNLNNNIDNSKAVKNNIHKEFFLCQRKLSKKNNNKKKRTYSYNGGYISYLYNQRFETENNSNSNKTNITKVIDKKNNNIFSNIYNNTSKNNTGKNKCLLNKTMNNHNPILSKIKINQKMKIPHNKFDKSKVKVINEKMNNTSKIKKIGNRIILDISNQIKSLSRPKIKSDKFSIHRKIFSSIGLENRSLLNININKNISFKSKKLTMNKIDNNFESNNKSQIFNKRKKHIINSNENMRLPTYSDSRSSRVHKKIRSKIINNNIMNEKSFNYISKANSGLLKIKMDSDIENKRELDINISNRKQTLIILKEKIKFTKIYQKNSVIEKMKKNCYQNKSSFIVLCEKKKEENNEDFIFCGLFMYNDEQKQFIKIYGNTEIQNYIYLKDINNSNYIIYENKIIQNEERKIKILFEKLNSFYFSFNSIIIIAKK
jgi:hypothetical protein